MICIDRLTTADSLSLLAHIYVEMPRDWRAPFAPALWEPICEQMRQSVENNQHRVFAAHDSAGPTLGFAWLVEGKEPNSHHLKALWVSDARRGSGIGSELLDHIVGALEELNSSHLTANIHFLNSRAISFALRRKFKAGYVVFELNRSV